MEISTTSILTSTETSTVGKSSLALQLPQVLKTIDRKLPLSSPPQEKRKQHNKDKLVTINNRKMLKVVQQYRRRISFDLNLYLPYIKYIQRSSIAGQETAKIACRLKIRYTRMNKNRIIGYLKNKRNKYLKLYRKKIYIKQKLKKISLITTKSKGKRIIVREVSSRKKSTLPATLRKASKKVRKEVLPNFSSSPKEQEFNKLELSLPSTSQVVCGKFKDGTNIIDVVQERKKEPAQIISQPNLSEVSHMASPSPQMSLLPKYPLLPMDHQDIPAATENISNSSVTLSDQEENEIFSLLKKFQVIGENNDDLRISKMNEQKIDMRMLLRLSSEYDVKLTQFEWIKLQKRKRRETIYNKDEEFRGFDAQENFLYYYEGLLKMMAIERVIINNETQRRNLIIEEQEMEKKRNVAKNIGPNKTAHLSAGKKLNRRRINNKLKRLRTSLNGGIPKILTDLYHKSYDEIMASLTDKKIADIEKKLKDYRLIKIDDTGEPQNLTEYLKPYEKMWEDYMKNIE